jgi:lipopolysaccharide transport system permease protein
MGQRAKISAFAAGSVPSQVYAVFGVMMLQTFLEALNTQRSLFVANTQQLSRGRTPIECMVLAGMGDNMFGLILKMPVVVGVLIVFGVHIASTWFLGLLGFFAIYLLGTAIGLMFAPINALKADVENVMVFLPWLLIAVTPVFVVPKATGALSKIYHWNPLALVFNATRAATYGTGAPNAVYDYLPSLLTIFAISVILTTGSWLLCRIARPYVVERYLT